MNWNDTVLVFVFVAIVVAYALVQKLATDELRNRALAVFCQYVVAFLLALSYAVASGSFKFELVMLWAVGIGIMNAWANYSYWQAFAVSMSKTAIFLPLSEVLGIGLAVIFLNETNIWNWQVTVGVLLCFGSMWLPKVFAYQSRKADQSDPKWLRYTLWLIFDLALITFFTKLLATDRMPRETFLAGFYGGSVIGAALIFVGSRQSFREITGRMVSWTLVLGLGLVTAQAMMYTMFQRNWPMTVVLPIRGVAMAVFPSLIGYFLLRGGERKTMARMERVLFFVGLAGALLLVLR